MADDDTITGANPEPQPNPSDDIVRLQRSLDASRQELRNFKERFSGVDLEEHVKLKKQAEALRDKKLIEEGQVETLIQTKLSDVEKDHKTEVETLRQQLSARETALKKHQIAEPARTAAIGMNVVSGMDKYIVQEVQEAFAVDEKGDIVGRDENGQLLLDKQGNRMTIKGFVAQLRDDPLKKHLFRPAQGAPDNQNIDAGTRTNLDGIKVLKDTPENRSLHVQEIFEGKIILE